MSATHTQPVMKWGVIAPGRIAHNFAKGISVVDDACITAVASRDKQRATAFAEQYEIDRIYLVYAELIRDPDIDAIYIATPHAFHFELAKQCLLARKPVLCEKPLTMNAAQSQALASLALEQSTFIMEALWSKFLPVWRNMNTWLAQIGAVKQVHSSFCFKVDVDPNDRLFDPILGGGALHDIGIYNIALSNLLFGQAPCDWKLSGDVGQTGVEETVNALLDYGDGRHATFHCSFHVDEPMVMQISGTHGRIVIDAPFFGAQSATLYADDNAPETFQVTHHGGGFEYQIREAMACIRNGLVFSEIHPLSSTIEHMSIIDQMRAELGIRTP